MGMQKKYMRLEVDDIFPLGEFTVEEVKFIEKIIDQIHVDIAYDSDFILSTRGLIHLITGIIRSCDGFTGTDSKNNSKD
jgi:hypothetical protein